MVYGIGITSSSKFKTLGNEVHLLCFSRVSKQRVFTRNKSRIGVRKFVVLPATILCWKSKKIIQNLDVKQIFNYNLFHFYYFFSILNLMNCFLLYTKNFLRRILHFCQFYLYAIRIVKRLLICFNIL